MLTCIPSGVVNQSLDTTMTETSLLEICTRTVINLVGLFFVVMLYFIFVFYHLFITVLHIVLQ